MRKRCSEMALLLIIGAVAIVATSSVENGTSLVPTKDTASPVEREAEETLPPPPHKLPELDDPRVTAHPSTSRRLLNERGPGGGRDRGGGGGRGRREGDGDDDDNDDDDEGGGGGGDGGGGGGGDGFCIGWCPGGGNGGGGGGGGGATAATNTPPVDPSTSTAAAAEKIP